MGRRRSIDRPAGLGAVPSGLALILPLYPGTSVPGFHMPPLRG